MEDIKMKKLGLSSNKVFLGVCGGLANYLNIDVSIIRIIVAVITICSAGIGGLLAYGICYLILKNA